MQLAGEEAGMVEEILSTVTTAYNTLSDVVKKERYDELLGSEKGGLGQKGDDVFQAQVQFQSGKVFIDMEEWDSAEKALQDAVVITSYSIHYTKLYDATTRPTLSWLRRCRRSASAPRRVRR